ncbi:UPF0235 protein C15orf40 homolog [Thomomys bottae]
MSAVVDVPVIPAWISGGGGGGGGGQCEGQCSSARQAGALPWSQPQRGARGKARPGFLALWSKAPFSVLEGGGRPPVPGGEGWGGAGAPGAPRPERSPSPSRVPWPRVEDTAPGGDPAQFLGSGAALHPRPSRAHRVDLAVGVRRTAQLPGNPQSPLSAQAQRFSFPPCGRSPLAQAQRFSSFLVAGRRSRRRRGSFSPGGRSCWAPLAQAQRLSFPSRGRLRRPPLAQTQRLSFSFPWPLAQAQRFFLSWWPVAPGAARADAEALPAACSPRPSRPGMRLLRAAAGTRGSVRRPDAEMPKKAGAASKGGSPSPAPPGPPPGPVAAHPKGGVTIAVHARPGSRQNAVADLTSEAVSVAIAAPPTEGEANAELCRYLSRVLDLRKSEVVLEKGGKSREKVVKILASTTPEEILEKLKKEAEKK